MLKENAPHFFTSHRVLGSKLCYIHKAALRYNRIEIVKLVSCQIMVMVLFIAI